MHISINRRLRMLYLAVFFQSFVLWYAIEKLFLVKIGFNSASIGVLVVFMGVIGFLFETPSGILADRWSRKGVLMLASISLAISCVAGGLSTKPWQYFLGISFWGIFFAMYSGTYESIVYDSLSEQGETKDYEKYYGRVRFFEGVALVGGSLLSGVVTHYLGLRGAYFMTVPFVLVSLFCLARFKEPVLHKAHDKIAITKHTTETLKAAFTNTKLIWVLMGIISIEIGLRAMLEFNQLWYIALALPLVFFGPANAIVQSALGLGGLVVQHFRNSKRLALFGGITLVSSSVALTFRNSTTIIVAQFFVVIGFVILSVVLNRYLHDGLPSRFRAGSASAVSTLNQVVFIPIGLLFGQIAQKTSVFNSAWIIVVLTILGLIATRMVNKHELISKSDVLELEIYPK